MEFKEILARERKARSMSQEDLAARLQVSRQAVSKWETGDALPDLPKLLALAETLDLTLDALCGRQAAASPPPDAPGESAPPAIPAPAAPRRLRVWQALCGLLAACLLAGGIWVWSRLSERAVVSPPLPDPFTVTGVNFCGAGPGLLTYQFVPSIIGETYTYQITFTGDSGEPVTFDASCIGGVCTDTVYLSQYGGYFVTALVSDGISSRAAVLAGNLTFSETGASWTPGDA